MAARVCRSLLLRPVHRATITCPWGRLECIASAGWWSAGSLDSFASGAPGSRRAPRRPDPSTLTPLTLNRQAFIELAVITFFARYFSMTESICALPPPALPPVLLPPSLDECYIISPPAALALNELVDFAFTNRVIFFNEEDKKSVADLAGGRRRRV